MTVKDDKFLWTKRRRRENVKRFGFSTRNTVTHKHPVTRKKLIWIPLKTSLISQFSQRTSQSYISEHSNLQVNYLATDKPENLNYKIYFKNSSFIKRAEIAYKRWDLKQIQIFCYKSWYFKFGINFKCNVTEVLLMTFKTMLVFLGKSSLLFMIKCKVWIRNLIWYEIKDKCINLF